MKRVAVCVSGCPRSWMEGLRSHRFFFEECERNWEEKVQLTYFMVFWDFCCPSLNFSGYEDIRKKFNYGGDPREFRFPFDLGEQEWMANEFRPAYIEFKSFEDMQSVSNKGNWLYPSAYLMKEVLRQRRLYEACHSSFDLCLWCRSDVVVCTNEHTNLPKNPKGLVGDYLYRSSQHKHYIGFRDLFFYGCPGTVDLAASIYPEGVIGHDDPVYTDAGYIEEEFYKNLQYWGIPIESFGDFSLEISRRFEEDLLGIHDTEEVSEEDSSNSHDTEKANEEKGNLV